MVFRTFSARFNLIFLTRGDTPRVAWRLPLPIIFRAFGAGGLNVQRRSSLILSTDCLSLRAAPVSVTTEPVRGTEVVAPGRIDQRRRHLQRATFERTNIRDSS